MLQKKTQCLNGLGSRVCTVLGGQWGDEGKGKLVDLLAPRYDVSARFNGGDNAGHTVVRDNVKYAFHLVPCGIINEKTKNLLGNGCVINLGNMFNELKQLDHNNVHYQGRMLLSDRAHLVTQYQLAEENENQKQQNLGTTKKGIGPTYASKIYRYGLRVGDICNWDNFVAKYRRLATFYPRFKKDEQELDQLYTYRKRLLDDNMIIDGVSWINQQYAQDKTILIEGANAGLLDIDLGTYPYVTSSNTTIGGVGTGLGFNPRHVQTVIGVVKAYTTRVGEGPFPTEQQNEVGQLLRDKGHEYGTTTGRPRRCGWLDLSLVRYTGMVNGYDSINITKLDILDTLEEIKVGVGYRLDGKAIEHIPASLEDFGRVEVVYETLKGWQQDTSQIRTKDKLPKQALEYLSYIEKNVGIPVSWVGTGPGNDAMIQM